MSKRNKLEKFESLSHMSNVFQNFDFSKPQLVTKNHEEVEMTGKWNSEYFKNDQPIVLELACGRGEYCIGLSEMFPNKNFIGIDIKGARIYQGAKDAAEKNLSNVAFIRTKIELSHLFFAANEIDEIWITFPDPFKKKGQVNRRLTAVHFLKIYRTYLKPNGLVRLKTDASDFFEFTLEELIKFPHCTLIEATHYINKKSTVIPELKIQTYYEKKQIDFKTGINYAVFALK